MDNSKVYVNVIAAFANDGRILPLSLTWDDGREFKIDQVSDIRQAAAMKAGGQGDRYTVRVQGRDKYLFFERNASIGVITSGDGSLFGIRNNEPYSDQRIIPTNCPSLSVEQII